MTSLEILSIITTFICLVSFSTVFIILFKSYFKSIEKNIVEGKEDIELIDAALLKEKNKKKKSKRVLSIIWKITSYSIIGLLVVFFSFSLITRFTSNSLPFNNSTLVTIASGSMSEKNPANTYLVDNNLDNQFDTYDMIGVTRYKSEEDVKLYDVIAFKSNNNKTVIHRIIKIESIDGKNYYTTRGDSNSSNDNNVLYGSYLTYESFVGYYNGIRIKGIGAFVIFLQSGSGIITVASILVCFIMFDYYKSKTDKAMNKRTNMLIELIDDEIDTKEIKTKFKQELFYKGNKYTFENGQLISKEVVVDSNINKATKDTILMIDDHDGQKKVRVKNMSTKHIEEIDDEKDFISKRAEE